MKTKLAEVDGVKLEVRSGWDNYVPFLDRICNGVGPSSWSPRAWKALDLLPYLLRSSRVHDVDCEAGGDESARKVDDQCMRRNCDRAARMELGAWYTRIWTRKGRVEWSWAVAEIEAAYTALRVAWLQPQTDHRGVQSGAANNRADRSHDGDQGGVGASSHALGAVAVRGRVGRVDLGD